VNDFLLGVIAAAVVVMAAIQVAAVVYAARAARRIGRLAERLEQDMRPIVANLQTVTTDAARATALAATQVERADRLFTDLSQRIEQTLASIQEAVVTPARDGFAWLSGLKAMIAAFREIKRPAHSRQSAAEDEDSLFIG
jgi:hypothetical protein